MQVFAFLFVIFAMISALSGNHIPSGTLKLIIKTYINDLLESSQVIDEILKTKLTSLGDHVISHPALYQKHLYVGDRPPDVPPELLHLAATNETINKRYSFGKRQHSAMIPHGIKPDLVGGHLPPPPEHFPSDEICSTNRQWEQINNTHDFYENEVEVVHQDGMQQFIYTYRCASTREACMGISSIYHSECTERLGWVYMYYRKVGEEQSKWGYVATPHHCACKIQPKFAPSASSEKKKKK